MIRTSRPQQMGISVASGRHGDVVQWTVAHHDGAA